MLNKLGEDVQQLNTYLALPDVDLQFVQAVQPLYDEASESVRQLGDDLELAKQMYGEALKKYAEPSDTPSDELFGHIHRFLTAFEVRKEEYTRVLFRRCALLTRWQTASAYGKCRARAARGEATPSRRQAQREISQADQARRSRRGKLAWRDG